jgi:hypothetical protein
VKKEELLAQCIEDIRSGEVTPEECIARYPNLSSEFKSLLKIAADIKAPEISVTEDFRQRARMHLQQAMNPLKKSWSFRRILSGQLGPAWSATMIIAIYFVLAGGTVYASQSSLPSDFLYPLKRGLENTQLAFTFNSEARASTYMRLAERRTNEIIIQSQLTRDVQPKMMESAGTQIDNALKTISYMPPENAKAYLAQLSQTTLNEQLKLDQALQVKNEGSDQTALKQTMELMQRGNLVAGIAYSNPAVLGASPSVLSEGLEKTYFKMEGAFKGAEDSRWNIGGLAINDVTSPPKSPAFGQFVEIQGLIQGGHAIISQVKLEMEPKDKVKIEGNFSVGSSPDSWYVGGIPIGKPAGMLAPPVGSYVELVGTMQNGILVTSNTLSRTTGETVKVGIIGVLDKVDAIKKTAVLNVTGGKVDINLSEAIITDDNNNIYKISDIQKLIGQNIVVDSAYRANGNLYARMAHIESAKHLSNYED